MAVLINNVTCDGADGSAIPSDFDLGKNGGTGALAQITGNMMELRSAAGTAGTATLSVSRKWSGGTTADLDITFRMRVDAEAYPRLYLRCNRTDIERSLCNGYYVSLYWDGGGLTMGKTTSGSSAALSGGSGITFAPTYGQYWYFRIYLVGSAFKLKFWQDGTSEPGTWNKELTDTSFSSAGYFGWHLTATGVSNTNKKAFFDNIYATDGVSSVPATALPSTASLSATVPAPSPGASADVTPVAVPGVVSVPAPAISLPRTVSPALTAHAVAVPAPAIVTTTDARPAPAPLSRVVTVPAPTPGGGSRIFATAVQRAAGIPAPTVLCGAVTAPNAVPGTSTAPAVSVAATGLVAPAVTSRAVTVPAAFVSTGLDARPAPASVARFVALPSPSLSATADVLPSAVSRSVVLPAPSITNVSLTTVSPGSISRAVSVPTIGVTASAQVLAEAPSRAVSVPAPVIPVGSSPTPSVISRSAILPAAAVTTVATVTPDVVRAVSSIASAGVRVPFGASVPAAVIAGVIRILTPLFNYRDILPVVKPIERNYAILPAAGRYVVVSSERSFGA